MFLWDSKTPINLRANLDRESSWQEPDGLQSLHNSSSPKEVHTYPGAVDITESRGSKSRLQAQDLRHRFFLCRCRDPSGNIQEVRLNGKDHISQLACWILGIVVPKFHRRMLRKGLVESQTTEAE